MQEFHPIWKQNKSKLNKTRWNEIEIKTNKTENRIKKEWKKLLHKGAQSRKIIMHLILVFLAECF